MQITEATSANEIDVYQRSKFSYRTLAQTVPIQDNGEAMVIVLETDRLLLQPFWEIPGDLEGDLYQSYIAKNPDFTMMVRRTVAQKLNLAAQTLPADWKLVIKAGYRPLTVQHTLLAEVARQIKAKTPGMSDVQTMQHARTFVTDPAIMCPPHCTGAAIDVNIINAATGTPIDMGCPPNTDNELAFTHYSGLTAGQVSNRAVLLETMFEAGFANLAHEWWHFSYGDQYWAAFYSRPYALFNLVDEHNLS